MRSIEPGRWEQELGDQPGIYVVRSLTRPHTFRIGAAGVRKGDGTLRKRLKRHGRRKPLLAAPGTSLTDRLQPWAPVWVYALDGWAAGDVERARERLREVFPPEMFESAGGARELIFRAAGEDAHVAAWAEQVVPRLEVLREARAEVGRHPATGAPSRRRERTVVLYGLAVLVLSGLAAWWFAQPASDGFPGAADGPAPSPLFTFVLASATGYAALGLASFGRALARLLRADG
jgi:hypothetical protein